MKIRSLIDPPEPVGASNRPAVRRRKGKRGGMTLREYFNTPESLLPAQLVDGDFMVRDAPSVSHQRIVLNLAIALRAHLSRSHEGEVLLAPVDVVLDPDRPLVVQPDLVVVSDAREHFVQDRIYGAPDLAIEILSPDPRIGRLDERMRWFVEYGVREIWAYRQPLRRMDVTTCDAGAVASRRSFGWRERIESTVLPTLSQTLGEMLDGVT